MRYGLSVCAVVVALVVPALPASAHHEITAKFDPARTTTLTGVVTKLDWLNPHVHVFMDVTQGTQLSNWAVEMESPIDLEMGGWSVESLSPGEAISVSGMLARDGSRQIWGEQISRAGEALFDTVGRPRTGTDTRPAPRWPGGQPRLGPEPGGAGYWGNPTATSLMEVGVEVEVDDQGLLANIEDASRVAPFQDWALALYEERQRVSLASDPMFLYCIPQGGPRQYQLPYGIQFVEERARQRVFVLLGAGNRNWRLIYTDGRDQVGAVTGDDDNPLYFGRSVARWEGDTFVVDTIGFNERFWFSNGGLPHTDDLHLIERFTRTNLNTMRYQVTIDDPGAYTRSWNAEWNLEWIPGEETPLYYCQDNRP